MRESMKKSRVKGFLDVSGKKIINEDGEEVLLTGWGLGNWLLCEGYMWNSFGSTRFDRPRRIEEVIEELTGREYADKFWKRFRAQYISEDDIRYMSSLGYNSVRIPINYRLFMEEGEKVVFKEEGFELLNRCLDWCEKYKVYAFIDLHGAPGGQTGSNIDDCIDDMPRLFLDQTNFIKGIVLWREIAERYHDRWIVAGYDLLNEPIRPKRVENEIDVDYLIVRLQEFYEKTIATIRKVDKKHLISLEGHHWAQETDVFCKKYDDKMILHFHRYGVLPDINSYKKYIEMADKWNCPLWLGESGENIPEWFAAMYPLASELNIGYNVWPWKKMNTKNSPCSVKRPDGWDEIINYTKGGKHPGYEKARSIFDAYLENIKLGNCDINDNVSQSVLRQPGCTLRAVDFDEFPGKGKSYSGIQKEENPYRLRMNTSMNILRKGEAEVVKIHGFDCGWQHFVLGLQAGEFADYTWNDIEKGDSIQLSYYAVGDACVEVLQNEQVLTQIYVKKEGKLEFSEWMELQKAEKCVIRIQVVRGIIEVDAIYSKKCC